MKIDLKLLVSALLSWILLGLFIAWYYKFPKISSLMRRMKVLLGENPHVPIRECRKVVEGMERDVKALRKRELRRRRK